MMTRVIRTDAIIDYGDPTGYAVSAERLSECERKESTSAFGSNNPIAKYFDTKKCTFRKVRNSDVFDEDGNGRDGTIIVRLAIGPILEYIKYIEKLIHRLISRNGAGDIPGSQTISNHIRTHSLPSLY